MKIDIQLLISRNNEKILHEEIIENADLNIYTSENYLTIQIEQEE